MNENTILNLLKMLPMSAEAVAIVGAVAGTAATLSDDEAAFTDFANQYGDMAATQLRAYGESIEAVTFSARMSGVRELRRPGVHPQREVLADPEPRTEEVKPKFEHLTPDPDVFLGRHNNIDLYLHVGSDGEDCILSRYSNYGWDQTITSLALLTRMDLPEHIRIGHRLAQELGLVQ